MSNVINIRPRIPPQSTLGAIGKFVRTFVPGNCPPTQDTLARDRAALELRHWVAVTVNAHGADAALDLLEFQIERIKAKRETCP